MVLMDEKVYSDQLKIITKELLVTGVAKNHKEAEETARQWLSSVENDIVF